MTPLDAFINEVKIERYGQEKEIGITLIGDANPDTKAEYWGVILPLTRKLQDA